MKKRAFTLIETLVALGIIIVILGASVTANRVLISSTQGAEDKVQMEAIVDEGIQLMYLLERQESIIGGSIGNYINGNSSKQIVIPYTTATTSLGTPNNFEWCTVKVSGSGYGGGNSGNSCSETVSVVQTCGTDGAQKMFEQVNNVGIKGELIGVRRSSLGWAQLYYSFTSMRSSGTDTTVYAPSVGGETCQESTPGMDFYVRTINIKQEPASGWFSSIGSGNSGFSSNKIYRVTVKVSKYLDPSVVPVSRSFILTDYFAS